MSKKISRRSFLKRILGTTLTTVGISCGGYVYAGKIEPTLLKINRHTLNHSLIPTSFNGFKIVQFSDTHLGFQYTIQQLIELTEIIQKLEPDILLFTGDLLDAPNEYDDAQKVIQVLTKLHAPYGKFAVYGNHDHGGYGTDLYRQIMEAASFQLLLNEARVITNNDKDEIYLLGIDDAMLGTPDLSQTVKDIPQDAYKILLSHAPDLADYAVDYNIHLQLSGHSHGGQIQLPFFGAFVKPPYAEKYYEGFYTIGKQHESPLTLYVNRGLGTTRMPFRFLSVPEVTLFTLKNHE